MANPEDPVAARLDADRKALLDLSLRNPLLNYRPRARGLEVVFLPSHQFVGSRTVEEQLEYFYAQYARRVAPLYARQGQQVAGERGASPG